MNRFNIDQLLRYVLGGFFFICVLYLETKNLPRFQNHEISMNSPATIVLSAILFTGMLIHTLYRAIPYPFVYNWLTICFVYYVYYRSNNDTKNFLTEQQGSEPSNVRFYRMNEGIDRLRNKYSDKDLIRPLGEWASQVHFLYNIAFTSVLLCGIISWWRSECATFYLILLVVFHVLGAIHHIRYKISEIERLKSLKEKEKEEKKEKKEKEEKDFFLMLRNTMKKI